jgi:NAD(P)-dependent dehydrogenase (short-subunit alcohol dehydrogenase family)
VFNPAGILRDRMFHKMSPEDWHAVIDVHLTGHFNVVRSAINLFREQEYGRVIMVSSTSGLLGNVGQANYGAAKLGIVALARIVAMENASKGITCNVIAPSADTRMTRSVPTPKDPEQARIRDERLRRSRADAIAPLCVFLASEGSKYVNGQVFHQRASELSLYGLPKPVRMVHHHGGWTPELIGEVGMPALKNQFFDIADARTQHPGLPME